MKKVMSCIMSFLPLVSMIIVIAILVTFGISIDNNIYLGSAERTVVIGLTIIMLLYIGFMTGVIIYYIVKACRNSQLSTGMKVFWCFMFYQFNVFVFPVYWFMYIRKE